MGNIARVTLHIILKYDFFQFISEPTVVPKDFRLDPLKPVEPHKAHFIWEAVDTAEQKIRGDFKGYKVTFR